MGETTAMPIPGSDDRIIGNRYRMEALIGRGGSAEVWRAEDTSLGRQVAVKLVTASGGEDAGRVGDEARLLARLSHPGLVPVYDAGTDSRLRPWVVMELVEGGTLADEIGRGPVEPLRAAKIGRVLAEALEYVHGQGLVHRDVKPANVLLGSDGRVRLTDFGIARLVDAAKVTATGLTVGTASYLSPEQVMGSAVGPKADVYSLGLVLLETLTGRREYPGTAIEVAIARLHRQPEVPDLPYGWSGLLVAMTALDDARRPTAQAVARDLARIEAGGEATTTVIPVARPAARADQTSVLRPGPAAAPRPVRPARPEPRPAPRPVEPGRSSSNSWAWALLLVALVAVGVVAALLINQSGSTGNERGAEPPSISPDLPQQLQTDLKQLQLEVAQ